MSVRDSGVTCALDKSDLQMLDDLRLTKIIKPDHYFTKFYSVNNWPFLQETKQVLFKKRTLLKLEHHKLIGTFKNYERLKPKAVYYRNYKNI